MIDAAKHRVLDYNDVFQCTSSLEDAAHGTPNEILGLLKYFIPEHAFQGIPCNQVVSATNRSQVDARSHSLLPIRGFLSSLTASMRPVTLLSPAVSNLSK